MKLKKIIKIFVGIVIFLTLPSLLFFGFIYFKYNEDLPTGIQNEKADVLANKMLSTLDYEAYKNTNYIEWSFKKQQHYKWNKNEGICKVYWKDYEVILDLNDPSNNKILIHSFQFEGENAQKIIDKAQSYFNISSFWLTAPYKVFDKGTSRQFVKQIDGNDALLVRYSNKKEVSGDSYLWLFDDSGRPISFKMWTSTLPIDGVEASWTDWTTTESGAQLPTFHKLLFMGIAIDNIIGTK